MCGLLIISCILDVKRLPDLYAKSIRMFLGAKSENIIYNICIFNFINKIDYSYQYNK